ncbi:hypothetical protein OsJ_29128 [Oryza sativa Japonica Group]|uniref:Uncharacterized protein n=1 Tax=Oryza sativa subsp. japonica TaxID=39947 RepID=B9G389_ORYSJ|nr:hypothetical protein OsJ_29128 [Oryza sativa Japonica Group]
MEFLRRLDIGEEREQEAARWWRRREDAATTSGAAGWWRREDVATTSAAAANRRVVPAFGGVAMTPGRIWADGNAVAGPPAPTPPWTPRPRRHGGMLGDDRQARGGPRSSWLPRVAAHLVAEVIVDHAADIMESIHGQRLLSCVLHNCCCELHEAIVAKITQHRDRSDGVVTMIRSCRSLKSCQLVRNAIVPWVGRRSKMQSLVTDSDKLRVIQACIQCFPADIAKVPVRDILANTIISLQDVNRHHPHCLKIFDILSRLGYMQ